MVDRLLCLPLVAVSIGSRRLLVVISLFFRCFLVRYSLCPRSANEYRTKAQRETNEGRTRSDREANEKWLGVGWNLRSNVCISYLIYRLWCWDIWMSWFLCRTRNFFIHGTISKGTPSKYLQVKLYVHYTNHILYVHYTNISTPTSPINCNLHFCHSIFWMNPFYWYFLDWPYFVSSVGRILFPQLAVFYFLSWLYFVSSVGRILFP